MLLMAHQLDHTAGEPEAPPVPGSGQGMANRRRLQVKRYMYGEGYQHARVWQWISSLMS
jgi:hypothetical protein